MFCKGPNCFPIIMLSLSFSRCEFSRETYTIYPGGEVSPCSIHWRTFWPADRLREINPPISVSLPLRHRDCYRQKITNGLIIVKFTLPVANWPNHIQSPVIQFFFPFLNFFPRVNRSNQEVKQRNQILSQVRKEREGHRFKGRKK